MRKLLCVLLLHCLALLAAAQSPSSPLDTLEAKLKKAKTPAERVDILGNLARLATNHSIEIADKWGAQMMEEAELSRDRKLIIKALLVNGERYTYMASKREYADKAIARFEQALRTARAEKLDEETAASMIYLAGVHLSLPDYDKASSYAMQALSIASVAENDSLKAEAFSANGDVYLGKKERLLALRYYLNALRIAELKKNHSLMRSCYARLSSFYASLEEYDKAIDFAAKSMNELQFRKDGGVAYQRAIDLSGMGNLYLRRKDYELSNYYFEKSLRLADSLKYPPLKMPAYNGLLNQYLEASQPQKALTFFNERTEFRNFITRMGMGSVIDMAYGAIYAEMGRYDSAQRYFERAAPYYETAANPATRLQFYSQFGHYYRLAGNTDAAIVQYEKARVLAETLHSLGRQQSIAMELDSLYARKGDYRQSYFYKDQYVRFKDSLEKLGEEKDLLQVELADEQQRQARLEHEKAAEEERRHTLQYMAITVAIGAVFVLLVLLGFFKVSAAVIKVLGFFSFIFFFEFLILIADNKIHHWTHGEPLKVLGIKVLLIAALLPLHHWLEHKVVHYLASRKLHEAAGRTGIARFLRRRREGHLDA